MISGSRRRSPIRSPSCTPGGLSNTARRPTSCSIRSIPTPRRCSLRRRRTRIATLRSRPSREIRRISAPCRPVAALRPAAATQVPNARWPCPSRSPTRAAIWRAARGRDSPTASSPSERRSPRPRELINQAIDFLSPGGKKMAKHHLEPSVETCHWGYFDATQKPVLKVKSGDIVTIDTVTGNPDVLPDASKFHIPAALPSILAELKPLGPHILTGPVYVEGAKPGNVLEVKIHGVSLLQDWGFNVILPLLGTLPHDYAEPRKVNIPLDKARNVGILPWGLELELKPFFGVMGVAPPKGWGRITSVMPQSTGGNLDNKELTAGATLYLPVFAEGALFSCGDGHGAQGDGEVCITAIETALRGVFEFVVRDDLTFKYPRAETDTHYITMGMDPDLDQCAIMALRDMIALLSEKAGLSHPDAYMLCSLAGDLHVTQTVNGSKGVHMMMLKKHVDA